MSHQFAASLLAFRYTTPSSETNDSIINCPFATIGHSEIIFISTTFIWDIKTT